MLRRLFLQGSLGDTLQFAYPVPFILLFSYYQYPPFFGVTVCPVRDCFVDSLPCSLSGCLLGYMSVFSLSQGPLTPPIP